MSRLWLILALVGMLSASSIGSAHAQVTAQQTYSGDYSGGAGTVFSPRFSGPITFAVNWSMGTFTCSIGGSGRSSGEGWSVTADVIGSTCSGSIDRSSGRLEGAISASAAVSYVDRNPEYNESSTESSSGSIVGTINPLDGSGSGTFIEGIMAWSASGPPAPTEPVEFAGDWSSKIRAPVPFLGDTAPVYTDVSGTLSLTVDPVKQSVTCRIRGGADYPEGYRELDRVFGVESVLATYAAVVTTEECQAALTDPPSGAPGQYFQGPVRLEIAITHDRGEGGFLGLPLLLGFSTTSTFVAGGEISGSLRDNFGSGGFSAQYLESSTWSVVVQDQPLTAGTFGVDEYEGPWGIEGVGGFPPLAGDIQFRFGRGTQEFRCGATGQGTGTWAVDPAVLIGWLTTGQTPASREEAAMVAVVGTTGGTFFDRVIEAEELEVQAKISEVTSCQGTFAANAPVGHIETRLDLDLKAIFPDGSSLTQSGVSTSWGGRISGQKSEGAVVGTILDDEDPRTTFPFRASAR